ncbi:MAG TPA: maleylpyruvate isomerase family mycothiol-dependent enzyme [Actinomycetota bacterium]|nr:maleylpyruvate isomerase family mycothiol-dependent enzyme [Actinomycetota bacterium]
MATVMGEVAIAYAGCRARLTAIVGTIDRERAGTMVPTCPDWCVHDVVSHLAGGVDDALSGNLEGLGSDEWTAAQVSARRETSTADVLTEWNTKAPMMERFLDPAGMLGRQAVADVVSHEHDIRTALSMPGARDSDAVRIGLGFAATRLIESAKEHGVSLRLRSTDGLDLGPGDSRVTLTGTPFELLRAATGRRSVEQLYEMDWNGDAGSVIPAFNWGPLHPSEKRIDE